MSCTMGRLLSWSVLAYLVMLSRVIRAANPRAVFNFNSNWRVNTGDINGAESPDFDDSNWQRRTLPWAWNEDSAFKVSIDALPTGIAWYRKTFQLPSNSSGKKLFLEFEGIRFAGEFYLNGKWIGRSENGVMAFGFDITNACNFNGSNVLAASINNDWGYREIATNSPFQWNDKNFYANYGGINKNVYLHVTDRLYQTLPLYSNLNTTGVYVYATDINVGGKSATIIAESQVKNEYNRSVSLSYRAIIADPTGKTVATLNSASVTLDAGQTQTVKSSGSVSNLEFWSWGYGYLYDVTTFLTVDGVDTDQVTTRTGFRKTEFHDGMFKLNDRTMHVKGYAQRTTNEWVALGSSVPAWLSDFSNQLALESNASLIRWMHVTPWKQDIHSLDRLGLMQAMPAGDSEGDPSGRRWDQRVELMRDAIIYNKNNPSIIFYECGNKGISEDHMAEMKKVRDAYDPYGGRAIGSREMLNTTVAEYGGEMLYINKNSRIPFWSMEYSRDEGLRVNWDMFSPPYHSDGNVPQDNPLDSTNVSYYDRNQDSHAIENVRRWYDYYEQRPGTGQRINSGGVNIIFSDSNTHHRGSQNYRTSGEIDAIRLPKDGWYAHQVMWNTWVDAEIPKTHIIGHWNYNASTTKPINVVSSTAKVELFLNNKSLGFGSRNYTFLFTFPNVTWAAGTLQAVGYDENDKPVSSDSRVTAGEPAALRLTTHTSPTGFLANGADVALVDVEVVDRAGNRCPTAMDMITFSLDGQASWRGGMAVGRSDNYILAQSLPVQAGINRVILRSTETAGEATLTATADGLGSASIKLASVKADQQDGFSLALPGADLPLYLARGPTPQGGYAIKRKAARIISSSSSSSTSTSNDSVSSYDDNEVSVWTAPGPSWITYLLESTVKLDQVVLKPSDFRTKSYSLSVAVDGKVVWQGSTPLSLGYVTLSFRETEGQNVTISSTKSLSIVEAEFYSRN